MIKLSFSEAKAKFASLWDRIIDERQMDVLQRKGKEDVVMMPASEARSLLETLAEQAEIKGLRGKLNWEGDLGELRTDA